MSMHVIFLGTAGSVPTLERSLPAVLMKRQNEQLMFDCGEGVQRQMINAKVGFHKKTKIFISHMHGDHVLGLPGLLQTMALMDRQRKIEIYGPEGIKQFLKCVKETLQFGLTFPVEIHEIYDESIICQEKEYIVEAVRSNHVVTSLAYAFVEKPRPGKFYPEKAMALGVPEGELWSRLQQGNKIELLNGQVISPDDVMGSRRQGRKIVYTGDTRPFKGFAKFAVYADLIIHDATFDDSLSEKAEVDGHSTPGQAAEEAKKAKAKKLVLTHISARYPDARLLLEQAQKFFKNTLVAEDFMELELPLLDS
ncbi:MAG: ribonuclease Z [Candidatus Bathyarchaeota archaeon]|nr:MAG: ribonuclease Z [Candidatus Bathyarchaeota archaeon]